MNENKLLMINTKVIFIRYTNTCHKRRHHYNIRQSNLHT